MIKNIALAGHASYGETPEHLSELKNVNFIFGTNGAGKTSLAQVIGDQEAHAECAVEWHGGRKLQALIYDREFAARNLRELRGVFTLGERQGEAHKALELEHQRLVKVQNGVDKWRRALDGADGVPGLLAQREQAEDRLRNACWAEKRNRDAALKDALSPYRGSEERFKSKILDERDANSAELLPLEELERKAQKLFGAMPVSRPLIGHLHTEELHTQADLARLARPILGKSDVQIAELIEKLSNSDWVQQGRGYLEQSEDVCPFCQQPVPCDLKENFEEYFDEAFTRQIAELNEFESRYTRAASDIISGLVRILDANHEDLDHQSFAGSKELLERRIESNLRLIACKRAEPSSRVPDLESIGEILVELNQLVGKANAAISEHNRLVESAVDERETLKGQAWRYLVEALKPALAEYDKVRGPFDKAIAGLTAKIEEAEREAESIRHAIQEWEKKTTSIQPTVDEINRILRAFGFDSFSIRITADGRHYELVRPDGTSAQKTLSEGEKTFLTFLYFFHLVRGSNSAVGVTSDRIVVFDDPVSSLDANVLFVVSSLVRSVIKEALASSGRIKQVFVLTHNVYFHREVTYRFQAQSSVTHWIVRRVDGRSRLAAYDDNPIRTSYQLLWEEVKNPDRSASTLPNVLRRILENYFVVLCGISLDDVCNRFDGDEKLICRSLISWAHAGSHSLHDDIFIPGPDAGVDSYLKVFRNIFAKMQHREHYIMMMGSASESDVPSPASSAGSDPVHAVVVHQLS